MIIPSRTNDTGGLEPDLPEGISASSQLLPDGTYRVTLASEEDAEAIREHIATPEQKAARRRRRAEEAGIILTMPDGSSFPIPTGREDRAMMDGAVLMLSQDPGRVIRWKAADGTRVPVDAPTLLAINAAVWQYVEECFDREGEIADDPENEDPDEGWPDRHRTLDLGG